MAIYLHFLDRELNLSVNARFNPKILQQVLFALLATTEEKFYCSLSLIFESSSEHLKFSKLLVFLVQQEIIFPISHHPTLKEFIYSRKLIYKHDLQRYPMYFQSDLLSPLNFESVPILHKKTSTTNYLNDRFSVICADNKLISENNHYTTSVNLSAVSEALRRGIGGIEKKALTFAAFKDCLPKRATDNDSFFIKRLISDNYSSHYIDFLNADIVTGIPEYSCFDYLSTNFPQYDYRILYEFYRIIFERLPSSQKRNIAKTLTSIIGTSVHSEFSYIVKKIIKTSYLRIFSTTGSSLNYIAVRDQLSVFINKKFIHPSLQSLNITGPIDEVLLNFSSELTLKFKELCRLDPIFRKASDSIDIEDKNIMTTILIATATDLESKKLYSIAEKKGVTPASKHFNAFSAVSLGVIENCDIYFVQSQMGSGGSGGSALTISDAIEQLKPDFVISLGIAFGSNPDKQAIGDILVSSVVRCYEPERIGSDKIVPRGDRMPSSPTLINRCNTAKLTWKNSDVHTGLLLSGEKLVDNSEFKQKLLDLEPEAIGGEMEGAGICAACYRKNVPWVIIKGICDWAENKDSKDQDLASDNAINYFWHILDEGAWVNIH